MAAGPVLELEAGNALELALIVGDKSEASGFGVSSNPEIITADLLTAGLERRADLAVGCRRFLRQRKHGQERHKPRERFQRAAEIGRASCRERGEVAVVAGVVNKRYKGQ